MVHRPQDRRGVVILIVLSLLVLFVLLVVTFAIVAGQYRRAAQAVGRREWLGEDPQKTADRVMYALLREPDPNQVGSPFRGHALLTDVYGQSKKGTISSNTTPLAGGQILQFNFTPSWSATVPNGPDALSGLYNGSVLTFTSTSATSRPLLGVSTRVVGYAYTAPIFSLRIVNPLNDGTTLPLPQNGDVFVLNGKPFVGTGFGYNSGAAPSEPRLSDEAVAPNRTYDPVGPVTTPGTLLNFLAGGANESYDAADYQNMILAAAAVDASTGTTRVLPSFHRPELISYWVNRESASSPDRWDPLANPTTIPADWTYSTNSGYREFRRNLIFRPMPWDHPNFTGSNPAFDASIHSADEIAGIPAGGTAGALFNGPWDVDNDGDGIKDSIWIDPDLPIQTTEDGRVFRPLVAIHCIDMDGRLNLNAQGNFAHIPGILPVPVAVPLAGGATSVAFPKGQGYGPPEVDLNGPPVTPNPLMDDAQYHLLLRARYGADGSPGRVGYDPLMPFKFYEYPGNYFASFFARSTHFNRSATPVTSFEALSAFGSNMDLRGLFACGVDHRGQPLYEGIYTPGPPPSAFLDQLTESPYEFNLNNPSGADAPFTVAELEKVLRYRDFDASTLQSRLTDLNNLDFLKDPPVGPVLGPANRRSVTTDSYDIPCPGVVCSDDYRKDFNLPYAQTVVELLAVRLSGSVNLNAEIAKMLSPDLMMGLRMDINRPLGNGRDDNGNGLVDEAHRVADPNLTESLGPEYALNGAANAIMGIDHDNDGVISGDPDAYLARHYLARHLYVLLMLLKERQFQFDFDGDANNYAEETPRVLAQWAINAVDFRDADSTMTPFEYDVNPFNGWEVDGDIATDEGGDRRVVWGCERPELLISETLAFHDVRTEDLDVADGPGTVAAGTDGDLDQRLRPRGALFVELYNPWAGHDKFPGELYSASAGVWGVSLSKVNSANQPVWRLAITDSPELDHLDSASPERTVYFRDPAALGGAADLGTLQVHYTTAAASLAPLAPGRYAVVGSGGVQSGSSFVTTIGRRTEAAEGGGLNLDLTRQIVLTPNSSPNVNQVEVRNNKNPAPSPLPSPPPTPTVDSPLDGFTTAPPANIQPAIAVPIDVVVNTFGTGGSPPPATLPIGLSISEPIGGYPDVQPPWDPSLADGEGAYSPIFNNPLDALPPPNTTLGDHRRVHLQRLANPLAPYDVNLNPYRTIDVMPVDLTVFNGVTATAGSPEYGCFQRGADDSNHGGDRLLWHQPATTDPPPAVALADATHIFGFVLNHTLGYLNASYGAPLTSADAALLPPLSIRPWDPTPPHNVPFYAGAPDSRSSDPFPWLPWNNRPYVSPTELLLVPRSSSSHLLRDFSIRSGTSGTYDNPLGRFHHLLNFFHQNDPNLATPNAANLYRVFEYLRVQPKFAGTETLLNPSTTAPHFGSPHPYAPLPLPVPGLSGMEMFHPPFNWISAYREPGRINLNTIYDERVWNAIWAGHQTISFSDFVDNRRGYGASGGNLFALDPASSVPTFFANPYRATGSALLVPPRDNNGDGNETELARLEVDSSLLRTNRIPYGPTAPAGTDVPRYLNAFTDLPRNSDRNPYFSYQALQRLSNLVTCRSNVYAMWLTIGYFEVEGVNAAGQPILGQEVGIDTGTVRRHRAFYIIDRSIPVAFEPGQNHNVDKCVVLRRMIE